MSVPPLTFDVRISTSGARLQVGDTLQVDVTATNLRKNDVGALQYRLLLRPLSGGIVLAPVAPRPVTHDVTLGPGQSDSATFMFLAVCSGEIALDASVTYESHAGYPGPATWEIASASGPVVHVSPNASEAHPICRVALPTFSNSRRSE